jgi:uncharacterized protein (UPF0335 family)
MSEPTKTNGLDHELVKGFVGRVENVHRDLESLKGTYMSECKALREDIGTIYDEAKDKGIPKRELKANVKRRALQRKLDSIRDDFEGEQLDMFDLIASALGDGAAAAA